MENLREQVLAIAQSAGIDESRVDKLVKFTTNWQEHEPSTVRKVMTAVLTAFGALIIGASFIGLLAVTMQMKEQLPLFLVIGITFFPAAFLCLSLGQETVGMTLMIIGLIASGVPASINFDSSSPRSIEILLFPVWMAISVFAIMRMRNRAAVFTALIIAEAYLLTFLILQSESAPIGLSATVLLNLLIVLFLSIPIAAIPLRLSARIQPVLLTGTILAATLFTFVLTFEGIYKNLSEEGALVLTLYNVLFFAATGAMVWFGKRRNSRRLIWIGGLFWFAFLVYKYYDLLWNLLDKSVVLITLGFLFIGAGYLIQRRATNEA